MDLKEYQSVKRWISRLSPSTVRSRVNDLNRWMVWLQSSGSKFADHDPDQLIEFQIESNGRGRNEILDEVQNFILTLKGRAQTKKTAMSNIRSFFMHNRASLPEDPSFKVKGDEPKVVGKLSPENVRDVILSCNEVFQAVFSCMLQAGMDQESFMYWNQNGLTDLKRQLKEDSDIIKIDLPGRKMKRNEAPFYTFIGPDAIKAVRNYFGVRPKDADAIFLDQSKTPLSKVGMQSYWARHLRKLGLIPRKKGSLSSRYGMNLHELRDCFRTLWAKSAAKPEIAEFLMGHQIDPLGYNKIFQDTDWVKAEYQKTLPWLNLLSSELPFNGTYSKVIEKTQKKITELENLRKEDAGKIQRLERNLKIMQYALKGKTVTAEDRKEIIESLTKEDKRIEEKVVTEFSEEDLEEFKKFLEWKRSQQK